MAQVIRNPVEQFLFGTDFAHEMVTQIDSELAESVLKMRKLGFICLYGLMKMDRTTVYLTLQKLNVISISAGGSVSLQKSSNISAPKRRQPVVKHRCIQAVRMITFDNRHRIKLLCTVWPCKVRR